MTYLAKVFEQYDCENPWKSQTKCPRTSGYIGIWHMFLSSKAFWGLNHTSLIRAAQHSSVLSKKSCFFQRITAVKCAPVVANDKCKFNILLEHHEDQKRHLMTMWAWGRTSTRRICCSKQSCYYTDQIHANTIKNMLKSLFSRMLPWLPCDLEKSILIWRNLLPP